MMAAPPAGTDISVSAPQEAMAVEVPCLKDVPTEVTPNLQDRLNGVTDVLSRVFKLVSEDLDKAVSSAVGQDKDGIPALLSLL